MLVVTYYESSDCGGDYIAHHYCDLVTTSKLKGTVTCWNRDNGKEPKTIPMEWICQIGEFDDFEFILEDEYAEAIYDYCQNESKETYEGLSLMYPISMAEYVYNFRRHEFADYCIKKGIIE